MLQFVFILLLSGFGGGYELKNLTRKNVQLWNGILVSQVEQSLELTVVDEFITRVKIVPCNEPYWEVPEEYFNTIPIPHSKSSKTKRITNALTNVEFLSSPFELIIKRNVDLINIFRIKVLKFHEQHIQFSMELDSIHGDRDEFNLYGLGEHTGSFRLEKNRTYTLFNKNHHFVYPGLNLYGSHPFWMQILRSGKASGIFFANSNAMDVSYLDKRLVFNVIGGVIDLYVFPGVSPLDVLNQYYSIIGRPRMIPAFALGYHQSKYGYNSTDALREVVEQYRMYDIPLESIWSDIDFMDEYKTFTISKLKYKGLGEFVDYLHEMNQSYVPIIDPGIKIEESYPAYDDGIAMDVFIKNETGGKPFLGRMFCGDCYFPDFEHPRIYEYWLKQFESLYAQVKLDAVWLDQNELTSFCDGFCYGKDRYKNKYDNPKEYLPSNSSIFNLSLSMSSKQHKSLHYNTHNLYALEECNVTISVLERIRKKRSFIVSRSSWAGLGRYAGHWLGDNNSSFVDLKQSIPGILSFNMFGINLVGADVGGFYNYPSNELMIRWHQLGAFYPFMRNHAHKSVMEGQELYKFPQYVRNIGKKMIKLRYSYHSYMYTLFYQHHKFGVPLVISPLIFVFPDDENCLSIDTQFMVGKDLLISPVLEAGKVVKNFDLFLPEGQLWYQTVPLFGTLEKGHGWIRKENVALKDFFYHIRGGSVIPIQDPKYSIRETRDQPFTLIVSLDSNGMAEGNLYIDDGEHVMHNKQHHEFAYLTFNVDVIRKPNQNNCLYYLYLTSSMEGNFSRPLFLDRIIFLGVTKEIVLINIANDTLLYDYKVFGNLKVDLLMPKGISIFERLELTICYQTALDLVFEIIFYCVIVFFIIVLCCCGIYFTSLYFYRKYKERVEEFNSQRYKKLHVNKRKGDIRIRIERNFGELVESDEDDDDYY